MAELTFEIEEKFNITQDPKEIKPLTVTENGEYEGGTVDGKDVGFSPVKVNVFVPAVKPFTVKENGIYDVAGKKIRKKTVQWKEKLDLEAILAALTDEQREIIDNGGDVCLLYDEWLYSYDDYGKDKQFYVLSVVDCEGREYVYDFNGYKAYDCGLDHQTGWFDGYAYWNDDLDPIPAPVYIVYCGGEIQENQDERSGGALTAERAGELLFTESMLDPIDAVNPVTVELQSPLKRIFDSRKSGADFFSYESEHYDPWYLRNGELEKMLAYDDTENITGASCMFYYQKYIATVPLFDTSNVTSMQSMFYGCSNLTAVPLFNTVNVTTMNGMFYSCGALVSVPAFDMRNVINVGSMFNNCRKLETVNVKNIQKSLQVASGKTWGHLLTVESLIHLIAEMRDTGSTITLTIGSTNSAKLENVYVRLVGITDEMRAADDLIDEKLPFELCESTDEGALHIVTEYPLLKNVEVL